VIPASNCLASSYSSFALVLRRSLSSALLIRTHVLLASPRALFCVCVFFFSSPLVCFAFAIQQPQSSQTLPFECLRCSHCAPDSISTKVNFKRICSVNFTLKG
jgi:hypothetical protein